MTDIALIDGGVGLEIQKRSMTKAHELLTFCRTPYLPLNLLLLLIIRHQKT